MTRGLGILISPFWGPFYCFQGVCFLENPVLMYGLIFKSRL
jgi:hypothetical protein